MRRKWLKDEILDSANWVQDSDLVVIRAKNGCTDDHFSYTVWITVGRRTSIFQISTAILTDLAWNADWCSTVGDSSWEVMNATSFMTTSQSTLIVTSSTWIICTNVSLMLFAQILNCFLYRSKVTATTLTDDTLLLTLPLGQAAKTAQRWGHIRRQSTPSLTN